MYKTDIAPERWTGFPRSFGRSWRKPRQMHYTMLSPKPATKPRSLISHRQVIKLGTYLCSNANSQHQTSVSKAMGYQVHGLEDQVGLCEVLQNQGEGMKGEFCSIYPHLDHHTGTEVPQGGKGGAVLSPTLWNSNRNELKWPLTAAEVSAHWPVNSRFTQYNLLLSAVTALQINLTVTVTGREGLFSPVTNSWCLPVSDPCISKYCSSAEFLSKLKNALFKTWLCSGIAQY